MAQRLAFQRYQRNVRVPYDTDTHTHTRTLRLQHICGVMSVSENDVIKHLKWGWCEGGEASCSRDPKFPLQENQSDLKGCLRARVCYLA